MEDGLCSCRSYHQWMHASDQGILSRTSCYNVNWTDTLKFHQETPKTGPVCSETARLSAYLHTSTSKIRGGGYAARRRYSSKPRWNFSATGKYITHSMIQQLGAWTKSTESMERGWGLTRSSPCSPPRMLEQKAYWGKRDAVAVETFGGVRPVGVLAPLAAASAEAGDRCKIRCYVEQITETIWIYKTLL